MPFDRTADAVGNHRYAMLRTQPDYEHDFAGAVCHDDAVGQRRLMDRFVATMLQAYRIAAGEALAKMVGELPPDGIRQVRGAIWTTHGRGEGRH